MSLIINRWGCWSDQPESRWTEESEGIEKRNGGGKGRKGSGMRREGNADGTDTLQKM